MSFHLSQNALLFYGLLLATLIFLSIGSNGIGVGGSFNAWAEFFGVFRVIITLEILSIVLAFILSLLPLALTVLLALLGAWVFSRIFGSGGTASAIEGIAGTSTALNLPAVLIFVLFLVLLL